MRPTAAEAVQAVWDAVIRHDGYVVNGVIVQAWSEIRVEQPAPSLGAAPAERSPARRRSLLHHSDGPKST